MPRGRPVAPVPLSEEERSGLLGIARSRSLPHAVVRRARVVLACAEGESNAAIAKRVGLSRITVGKRRHRHQECLAFLRHAVLSDPEVFDDMRRVSDYRAKQEWSQQRYQFWANYAEAHARTS